MLRFSIEVTRSAERDVDRIIDSILRRFGEKYLAKWLASYEAAVLSLETLADHCSLAREEEVLRVGLRRQLFGTRQNPYRVLFVVAEDEEEPMVRIVGVRHARRRDYSEEELRDALEE
ncbi:MAG: type II toxin-antitoxin system RelE/ParE family toxin [Myxococcota bacterium]